MASSSQIRITSRSEKQPKAPNQARVLWRLLTHFDRSKMIPALALRNTAGVVIPLVMGFALGMPRGGLAMASGALNVSYSDGHDPYPQRARRMLASTAWCAIAIFLGALTGRRNTEAIFVTTAWAFIAGMLVAIGATAADVGVISLVMLVVYAAQPLTARQAAEAGVLALAGGLLQTALSIALWPVRRYTPERRALNDLFQELAEAANKPTQASSAPPATPAATRAQEAIASLGSDNSMESVRFRALLSQAERIRLSTMMLSRLRLRMEREAPGHKAIEAIGRYLENVSSILRSIGEALLSNRKIGLDADRVILGVALTYQIHSQHGMGSRKVFLEAVLQDTEYQMDALSGQLRAAIDLANHASLEGAAEFEKKEKRQPLRLRFSSSIASLRANVNFRSTTFRHALRLAFAVAAGNMLGRAFDWRRSYWIPMTIVLVLKPEFAVTFTRGVLRVSGTILGLLLATALFHFLPIHTATEIILIASFTFLLRWVGPANYGVFAVIVSALVVLLLAINGVSPKEVILARGLNTAAGGVLALLTYLAWPTWERSRVGDSMAALLAAYREYFSAVARSYVEKETVGALALELPRQNSRTARTNLESSLERLAAEPGVTPEQINRVNAMLASTHRFAHAIMALEAGLPLTPPVPARQEFRIFAADVEETLALLEEALSGGKVAEKQFPNLREDHNLLIAAGDPERQRYALVNIEADRMTNSLNTLREEILEWARMRRDANTAESLSAAPAVKT
ncbi:MAG: FUSC family protein [Acidobacteria bacterium]|nr:FUSC family protein [Acidobacteriota bacterium]MBS1865088.1 FUSC family protein [Acidobacteriota bacterium]